MRPRLFFPIRVAAAALALFFATSDMILFGATLPTSTTKTTTAVSTTTTQTASQTLIAAQNAALALSASTIISSSTSLLYKALQGNASLRADFNLLYGTSIPTTGTPNSADITALNTLTSQQGFNQSSLLALVPKAADLYLAMKTSDAYRPNFNALYGVTLYEGTKLNAVTRDAILKVAASANFNQAAYLSNMLRAAKLYTALKANTDQRIDFNLIFASKIYATGALTETDRNKLLEATSSSTFNQTAFLSAIYKASELYIEMKYSDNYRTYFNVLYGTGLTESGGINDATADVLLELVNASDYSESHFLSSMLRSAKLYSALKADAALRADFNLFYGAKISATSATDADRLLLRTVTAGAGYSQSVFLKLVSRASKLYAYAKTSETFRRNFNLLFKTTLTATGALTEASRDLLLAIVGGYSTYSQTTFVAEVNRAYSLYKALQANSAQRAAFNSQFTAAIAPTGSPVIEDAEKLMLVVVVPGYSQTAFLSALTGTKPDPDPDPTPTPTPTPNGNLFSPTSFWNTKLGTTAVHSNSAGYIAELVANTKLAAPWINTHNYSTPIYTVNSATTTKVPVSIVQNGVTLSWSKLHQDLQKGVPIPAGVVAADGSDGHLTIYDTATDTLYEFWRCKKVNGKWQAEWGGIIVNASKSNGVMPTVTNSLGGQEWWGATATGLPVSAGVITLKELQAGSINHMLALNIVRPKIWTSFLPPATRSDGWYTGPNAIPEGMRFRLPASTVINPNWPPMIQMLVKAARDYGIVVRDQGGAVAFSAEDPIAHGKGDNAYDPYYGGLPLWDVMKLFPFDKLQVIA